MSAGADRLPVYIVAMPVGDRDDEVSPAVRAALASVDTLFVEPDPGGAARLRRRGLLGPHQALLPSDSAVEAALDRVAQGRPFAILASSGIPGFVDPGYQIVDALHRQARGRVELLPVGMSSALDGALACAGLDLLAFTFAGHFPDALRVPPKRVARGLPLVAFVRGDAVCAWVERVRGEVRHLHRHLLLRDIGKMGRSRSWVLGPGEGPPVDLRDEAEADFVAVVSFGRKEDDLAGKGLRGELEDLWAGRKGPAAWRRWRRDEAASLR